MMTGFLSKWHGLRIEMFRYLGISVIALAIDVALLWALSHLLHYLLAASIGFVAGAAVSYWLAIRLAFSQRRYHGSPRLEVSLYVLIGIVGLGINNLVIYVAVDSMQLDLILSKAIAAGLTFTFNYIVRKLMLFTAGA